MGSALRRVLWWLNLCLLITLGETAQAAKGVRIAAWNVFDLPEQAFALQSSKRMAQVASAIQQACGPLDAWDAIVINELYVPKDRKRVLADFASLGFTQHVELTSHDPRDLASLSGTLLVSRWPIEHHASLVFRHASSGLDHFTLKGAVFARLIKTQDGASFPINLFATHFYLGKPGRLEATRRDQAVALRDFIARTTAHSADIIVVAGDLNAPWHGDGPDVLQLLRAHTIEPSGDLAVTFPGEPAFLAGSPKQSFAHRCRRASQTHADGGADAGKWIDYVFAVEPGAQPQYNNLWAQEIVGASYHFGPSQGPPCFTAELSDHYLVVGDFLFE